MWFMSKKNISTIEGAALGEFIEKNVLSGFACAI
jgi:hypothetical protein